MLYFSCRTFSVCGSVLYADHVDFLYFFSSKLFFKVFLSELFAKACNSTGNSQKIYSFKVYRYVLLSSAISYIIAVCYTDG